MFEITILLLSVAFILILLDMSSSLKKMNSFLSVISNYYSFEDRNEEGIDKSSYEIIREERERNFDERIKQIQDELESNTSLFSHPKTSTPADILANGIYNIPHEQVIINNVSPATEFAD